MRRIEPALRPASATRLMALRRVGLGRTFFCALPESEPLEQTVKVHSPCEAPWSLRGSRFGAIAPDSLSHSSQSRQRLHLVSSHSSAGAVFVDESVAHAQEQMLLENGRWLWERHTERNRRDVEVLLSPSLLLPKE